LLFLAVKGVAEHKKTFRFLLPMNPSQKTTSRFIPDFARTALQATNARAWRTGRLFRQTALRALDAVQEVLRAEVRKGNVQAVVAFLRGTALPAARTLLLERMTTRLLLRIGLRGALASNVVGWILPFVLEKLVQAGHKTGLFDKLLANENVAETLARLEELRRTAWKLVEPDAGSSAEVVTDNETDFPVPRVLPPLG
jgi:hypothetical protein